ncbi:hypothetical protein BYT27DRAFT_7200685 [Phlegmacium glaucopus]|nr:hypothetical protein BYT27DRAFT_7200685 [Phlegmacium glaucopus]
MEEKESITPMMVSLSMNDHMPSSTSNGKSPIHLSALLTPPMNKFDPQIALQPTTPEVYHPMGSPIEPLQRHSSALSLQSVHGSQHEGASYGTIPFQTNHSPATRR